MAVDGVSLPFQEAIDFFRAKVNLPTERWDDLRHGAHVRAWSVAGVTRDDMLADFRAAMQRRFEAGTSFEDFRREFDRIVDATGWRFNARGSTEEARRNWRARVIYDTNLRVATMAGRYRQMRDPDVLAYRPYWRYRHNEVRYPRQQHLAWDGLVLSADDPAWKVLYPPNGWGCQCDVVALSRRDLARLGKSGPDPSPDLRPYTSRDRRTGAVETRYPGIDRGWEYNVGLEARDGVVPQELQAPLPPAPPLAPSPPSRRSPSGPAPEAGPSLPPAPAPARAAPSFARTLPPPPPPTLVPDSRLMPAGLPAESYVDAFLAEFGATRDRPAYFRDASGGVVAVSAALFETRNADGEVVGTKVDKQGRGPFVLLIADAIREPDEIWVDWVQVGTSLRLQRSYLRWVTTGAGRSILTIFRWARGGWWSVTGFPATRARLDRERRGALLFRRRTE